MTFFCQVFTSRSFHVSFRLYSSSSSRSEPLLRNLLLSMPKEPKHVPQLKSQRQLKKVQQVKYQPASVTLQVLGSGANGAPRSLYVFTDQSRYLFNCGEGSQRLAHEHKMKLAKLEHIFITHNNWLNLGGLPGVSLTIQDVGVPNISLHGPPCLETLFEGARKFMVLKDLEVSYINATKETDSFYEDTVLRVDYVVVQPQPGETNNMSETPKHWEFDTTDYYSKGRDFKASSVDIDEETIKAGKAAISYICRLQPKQGTLILDKCHEFGVPPGPLLGRLKSGEDVTLPSGKIVKAVDVRTPDDPGPVFLVVECPSRDYLEHFVCNSRLNGLKKEELSSPVVVVHFTPAEIIDDPQYRQWMEEFSPTTSHFLLGPGSKNPACGRGLGSEAVHRIQQKLNLIHPEIFPLLTEDTTADLPEGLFSSLVDRGETLLSYHLRPPKKVDRSALLKLDSSLYIKEATIIPGFEEALNELKSKLSGQENNGPEYPKFLFLGTGSCIPNKTRNTSGILVEIKANEFLLMDCGEGTYGQIVRFFGEEKAAEVVANLRAVYISHLHADHHIGLIGLLLARKRLGKSQSNLNKLFLIAPHQITSWLSWYDRIFEGISQEFELVPAVELFNGLENKVTDGLNLQKIQTTYVRHCSNAFGVAITTDEGFKFTYSGDTMPSDGLVRIGEKSQLLIHEATMEDGLEEEARIKTHSTTSQAIQIGKSMEADFTLLTHFSQRYAKMPIFNSSFSHNVGIAFDNMIVTPKHFPILPQLFPVLKSLFMEDYEEMEHKSAKRLKRLEVMT